MDKLVTLLQSPANWCGLALATLGLLPQALGLGLPVWSGWALPPLGYALGFALAGLWFGWPRLHAQPWDDLSFSDGGDARAAMRQALDAVQRLAAANPGERLPPGLQARVLALCAQLQQLLAQWERSESRLSLEDGFHARQIVLRYLPDALRAYLAIPARFASTKVLANGQTAEETLRRTVEDLSAKVQQLTDDLTTQDAEALMNHSRFLDAKFGDQAQRFSGMRK